MQREILRDDIACQISHLRVLFYPYVFRQTPNYKGVSVMRKSMAVICVAVLALAGVVNAGPKWDVGEDGNMQLSFLGQVHFLSVDGAPDGDDIYLRRARFILSGQIQDGLTFFVETDNDNAGKAGTDASTDIQDVFADARLVEGDSELWVKAGLILLPFSFETRASAASLLGIDYNVEAVKLVNTFVWRDYGAELHGNIGSRFSYAAGVFDGYDLKDSSKNPDAQMRYTGHVAVNIIGAAEKGWFFTQERMGAKGSYVSLGAGFDTQKDATLTTVGEEDAAVVLENDNDAWVVDMQSGYAREGMSATLNAAYYDWDNSIFKGNTAFVETGLLVKKTMVTLKYSLQAPDAGSDTADYTAGLHYFLKKHNARGGVEFRWGDSADQVLAGIQFLL